MKKETICHPCILQLTSLNVKLMAVQESHECWIFILRLGFWGFWILRLGRVVGTNSHGFNLRPRFLHTTSKNSESDKEHDLHAGLTPFADNYKYAAIL